MSSPSLESAEGEKDAYKHDHRDSSDDSQRPISPRGEASNVGRSGPVETVLFVSAVGFVYFNTWGLLLAFGVFQEFLQSNFLSQYSSSTISWIGTTWAALMLLGGAITGPIYDWGYARHLIAIGSIMVVFGMAMFSLSHTYYQVILSQGICVGIGSGMLYIPSLAAVAQSFDEGRSRAIGLASCGASIGGIIYPIVFRRLLPSIGFGWTVRVMALIALITLLVANAVLIPRCPHVKTKARSLVDVQAFTDMPFLAYCVAGFCILLGYYTPFIYLPNVATKVGASSDLVFYLIAITNSGSLVGRSLPTWIADKFGAVYVLVAATLCSAMLLFCWPAVHNSAGLIAWSVCWGAASGLVVALPGSVLPDLTPDPALLGTRMGMAWGCCAVGLLIGGPIGGALIDVRHGAVWPMQIFSGFAMFAGGALCIIPAVHLYRKKKEPPVYRGRRMSSMF